MGKRMPRKQWAKEFKSCKHKFRTKRGPFGARSGGYEGNTGCDYHWPLPHRCMYSYCPLIRTHVIEEATHEESTQ